MGDKLKQFIDDNRGAFDEANPGPKVLRRLKKQIDQGQGSTRYFHIKPLYWAAAIGAIIILSVVLYFSMQKKTGGNDLAKTTPVNSEERINTFDPLYARQIDRYHELIGLQQMELRQFGKDQPELYRQFANDINQLDSAYRVLKSSLATNPNREMLLEAMIRNLQFQSDLLNRQLSIIKEIKQKSKAHEKSSV